MSKGSEPIPSSSSKEEYDCRVDFFSDKFDPLVALQTPNLKVPCPSAKTHDNIEKYDSQQKRLQNMLPQRQPVVRQVNKDIEIQRAWLPHQLPVQVKNVRNYTDFFTKMSTINGPLSYLKECVDKRLQVKVFTRNASDIRGYCLGYLVVFDKHWNVLLQDVTEVWTRKKKRKLLPTPSGITNENIQRPSNVVVPKITITDSTKKTQTCQRSVKQLLIRGEQIAIISVS